MKKYFSLCLSLLIVWFILLGSPALVKATTVQTTPTLFVHGWGSSSRAEEKMVRAAVKAGVTKTVILANVDKRGQVTFDHPLPAKATAPIIEVNLEDNKLSSYQNDYTKGYHHGGEYLKNVILALEKKHHYQQINLVGHSMGNLEIINYLNDGQNDKRLPKVAHLVALAGHYNGLVDQKDVQNVTLDPKTGEPDKKDASYRELLSLRQNFPQETAVLNIYGDLQDGSHSDGSVPVVSAKSLKYLVSERSKTYTEIKITGKNAQHSKLHDNAQVDRALIKFLWGK